MRNLFLMMVLAITTITGNAQTLDSIVDYLEQDNEMAVQISDDPTTGFQRIAVYKRLTHDTRLDVINADVEVGYDLSKLEIQIDSIKKQIIINKIPKEEVVIIPNIKYFDLQQSQFNTFSKEELNKINQKSVDKIKETIKVTNLKDKAQKRLFAELSKIYQLSEIYNWRVVDNTNTLLFNKIKK